MGTYYVQVAGGNLLNGVGPEAGVFINTGGADVVNVSDLHTIFWATFDIQTYSSSNEADADRVTLANLDTYWTVGVRLGGGDDSFSLTDINAHTGIDIDAGAGKDNDG